MRKYRNSLVTLKKDRMYEIVRSPVITEKSTIITEFNQVSFQVPLSATKPEIRAAVEGLFEVKVTSVNTSRQRGKIKRFRGRLGRRNDTKKAVVTLAEGDTIYITAGV